MPEPTNEEQVNQYPADFQILTEHEAYVLYFALSNYRKQVPTDEDTSKAVDDLLDRSRHLRWDI